MDETKIIDHKVIVSEGDDIVDVGTVPVFW